MGFAFGKQHRKSSVHKAAQQQTRWASRRFLVEALEDRSLMAALAAGFDKSFLATNSALQSPDIGSAAAVSQPSASAQASALVDDAYENNDSFFAPYNLGTVTGPTTINNLVMADASDWYRFTTTAKSGTSDTLSIAFQNVSGNLDLALYNSAGYRLAYSNSYANGETIYLNGLGAGTYYVVVYGLNGVTNPSYSLSINLSGTPTLTDDTYEQNDTISTAKDLGTLTASKTVSNLVMADANDWYKFTMNGTGASTDFVSASFLNSQGNLDLELYNSAGTRLSSSNTSTDSERISLSGRAAGTYYVHVFGVNGVTNPSYSLSITPGIAATTPPPTTTSNFNIQFRFSGLTASQQSIFTQAAAKWQSIIVGDLPSATYNGVAIDDLLIDASGAAIDGVNGILGQAGPDALRSGSYLPYHGSMEFDTADLASMESNGTLLGVIEHEMGHVLGIGTIWSYKGLLTGAGGTNPLFVGAQATAAYNSIFGTSASGVPVENSGGSGTRDAHWRESILTNELMTGWVGPGTSMPISRITVASLADIGYTVNIAAADTWTPTGSLLAATTTTTTSSTSTTSHVQAPVADTLDLHRGQRPRSIAFSNPRNALGDEVYSRLAVSDSHTYEQAADALLSDWSGLDHGVTGSWQRA